jgi:hypothetical protein
LKQLVSSNEAANILGLSLQGIHYRIKKGQLESVKQDGKIYVYIDSSNIKNQHQNSNNNNNTNNQNKSLNDQAIHLSELALKSKDEQISILKKTIKFMRRQYTSEIERLDKNQQKILDVFQSEVDLLKSAFNEMKTLYQVEHKEHQEKSKEVSHQVGLPFMNLKEFFVLMRNYNKTDNQIKAIVLNRIKNGDKRFIYKKDTKEVIIFKNDFLDLI